MSVLLAKIESMHDEGIGSLFLDNFKTCKMQICNHFATNCGQIPHPFVFKKFMKSLFDRIFKIYVGNSERKLHLQEMGKQGSSWDEPLAEDLRPRWEHWRNDLVSLGELDIPRCYQAPGFGMTKKVELHHFSDASSSGYGQCDNGVVMLTFPPHCTHRLQPLERTFFRSLKAGYSRACDNWMTCHKGRPITQFDVIELFTTAYNTSATVASATNGFSAAGLWPFNDSKFDDELGNTDMPAETVVNDVVQRPIDHAITDDSVRKQSVIPDQHRCLLYLQMYMQCRSP